MKLHRFAPLIAAAAIATMSSVPSVNATPAVTPEEWRLYTEKFLDATGRIVDNANGDISHSEGQGYGLLLSYLAGDRGDFDRIWAFTRTNLMVRDDGLAAWKWEPAADPHITDTNNATDGDLLIAYAVALAGADWNRPDLTQAAVSLARAIEASAVEEVGGTWLIKPGAQGFGPGERQDGPVVNPSYWVFEAMPVMETLVPGGPWKNLADGGRALLSRIQKAGKTGLPPDWVSLKRSPHPAKGFPKEFGYNAIRVPLYLLRAGTVDRASLEPYIANMRNDAGQVRIVDVTTGETKALLDDPGYKIIPALIACALDRSPLPPEVLSFKPKDYYPSTLQLLSLAYARRQHPECL